MSSIEVDRLAVIERIVERRLSRSDGAQQLGITSRHMSRLVAAYTIQGAQALVSKQRGATSNNAFASEYRESVVELVTELYTDFGPTLAAEKLRERHDVTVSRETLRHWMMAAGLWQSKKQKAKRAYQPRHRRSCYGELIQLDGSSHDWFEGRAPKCTLLVYVDDATSALMELRFAESESTFDYFHSTQRYLEHHGKPTAFYSDKHGVFRMNQKNVKSGNGLTQFGRALHELNIDIIYANSSQAKGRVERMNLTLQDRLVKELRLEGINNMEEANAFLPGFIEVFNKQFAKAPGLPTDMHRELTERDELEEILCYQTQRKISNSLTVQYDKVLYLLEDNEFTRSLRQRQAMVFDYPDGTISVKYEGQPLPYTTFDKVPHIKQAGIVDNKRLGAALAFVHEKQKDLDTERGRSTLKRRGQQRIHEETHRHKNLALRDSNEDQTPEVTS